MEPEGVSEWLDRDRLSRGLSLPARGHVPKPRQHMWESTKNPEGNHWHDQPESNTLVCAGGLHVHVILSVP